ncbi:MAG: hypothetical protein ACOCZ8_05940 [Bacteroidota bacterium]
MFDLSFSSSPAWLLLFVLIAAGLSWWMYRGKTTELPRWLGYTLRGLRFLAVFVLLALILQPLLTAILEEKQPPIVAVLTDNSRSMTATGDSATIQQQLPEQLLELQNQLEAAGAVVRPYTFGNALERLSSYDSLAFDQEQTDISAALRSTGDIFTNQNLAAAVLISDGIPTQGVNPVNYSERFKTPVFTVLAGDTTERRDLLIEDVSFNELSYIDTKTPVVVTVRGRGIENQNVNVRLEGFGKQLASETVRLNASNGYTAKANFNITLTKPGLQQFAVHIDELEGEITTDNNHRLFFINVLETKLKIALFGSAPHPDIGALEKALGNDPRYTLDRFVRKSPESFYDGEPGDLKQYDLFILHNFPGMANDKPVIDQISETVSAENTPLMLFAGSGLNYRMLPEALAQRLPVKTNRYTTSTTEAFMYLAPEYKNHASYRFNNQAAFNDYINSAPPLLRNDSDWELRGGATSAMLARIKNIPTGYPLMVLGDIRGTKSVVMLAENFWRYRVHSYLEAGDFDYYDDWLQNLIQWVSVREDKRRFKVYPTERLFSGGEPVRFRGEVYDEAYNPLPGAEIKLSVTDPDGKRLDYFLEEPQDGIYRARLLNLSEGTYTYTATGSKDGKSLGTDEGQFSVGRSVAEYLQLQAQAGTMQQLANRTGGKAFTLSNMSQVASAVEQLPQMASVVNLKRSTTGLQRFVWPLLLVLTLLSVEWVLRKRHGLL